METEKVTGLDFIDRVEVLDDGFVELVDYMGTDADICKAARISYAGSEKRSSKDDRSLIRYMMRHWHTSPFEQCELKFHVRVPMDTWRQWVRHRTASVNEYSTRYSVAIDSAQRTPDGEWRVQDTGNKQGSSGCLPESIGRSLSIREAEVQDLARQVYEERIAAGVAREQARKDLPLSTYTEAIWKIDLHNLLHFLRLRLDPHAQLEIRQYAAALSVFVEMLFPMTWEAFVDYRLEAVTLSRLDVVALSGGGYEGMTEREIKDLEKVQKILIPPKPVRIVGVAGRAGSGKDTVAAMIAARVKGAKCVAQADPLKRFCQEVFGWDADRLWGPSARRSEADPDGLTARKALQTLGTEWGRGLREDVWIDYLLSRIDQNTPLTIITDVRFPNEARKIQDVGGVVLLVTGREGGEPTTHESESHFDTAEFRQYVSGTIDNSGSARDTHGIVSQLFDAGSVLSRSRR